MLLRGIERRVNDFMDMAMILPTMSTTYIRNTAGTDLDKLDLRCAAPRGSIDHSRQW
jgi:hypothetical protein